MQEDARRQARGRPRPRRARTGPRRPARRGDSRFESVSARPLGDEREGKRTDGKVPLPPLAEALLLELGDRLLDRHLAVGGVSGRGDTPDDAPHLGVPDDPRADARESPAERSRLDGSRQHAADLPTDGGDDEREQAEGSEPQDGRLPVMSRPGVLLAGPPPASLTDRADDREPDQGCPARATSARNAAGPEDPQADARREPKLALGGQVDGRPVDRPADEDAADGERAREERDRHELFFRDGHGRWERGELLLAECGLAWAEVREVEMDGEGRWALLSRLG